VLPNSDQSFADVSVIVPAYNAAATVTRALKSIAAQTISPREVIVVDDGSSDRTADLAGSCENLFSGTELIVISQDNKGAGAARNAAIANASSFYLAFLDADDEWLPEKLDHSMTLFRDGDWDLIAHNFWRQDETGHRQLVNSAHHFNAADDPYAALYIKGYIGTLTVVTKRELVQAAGLFDETLYAAQDFDLWLKILSMPAATFTVSDQALAVYSAASHGITSKTSSRLECTIRVAQRHASSFKSNKWRAQQNFLTRMLAVHYEAMKAIIVANEYWRLAGVVKSLAVSCFHGIARSA
jgi:glycosyltransferase involved in cell wall biosynthesis